MTALLDASTLKPCVDRPGNSLAGTADRRQIAGVAPSARDNDRRVTCGGRLDVRTALYVPAVRNVILRTATWWQADRATA